MLSQDDIGKHLVITYEGWIASEQCALPSIHRTELWRRRRLYIFPIATALLMPTCTPGKSRSRPRVAKDQVGT